MNGLKPAEELAELIYEAHVALHEGDVRACHDLLHRALSPFQLLKFMQGRVTLSGLQPAVPITDVSVGKCPFDEQTDQELFDGE